MTKKIGHPVQPKKNFFFAKFKNSSDIRDSNFYFDMKNNSLNNSQLGEEKDQNRFPAIGRQAADYNN